MEAKDVVSELNDELFDKQDTYYEYHYLTYLSDGYTEYISIHDYILWDSDNDEREWLEEENDYEPLLPYIKKVFNEYVDGLVKSKF